MSSFFGNIMVLSDTLIITKEFKTNNEFSLHIEELVIKNKISYMEAIIGYCEELDIDVESVGPLINEKLKDKIQLEAEQQNLIKPRGRLPF
jgi:hypothetical protein